jgi:hypothetical protein
MICSKIPTNCDKIRSSKPRLEGRIKKVTEKGEKYIPRLVFKPWIFEKIVGRFEQNIFYSGKS